MKVVSLFDKKDAEQRFNVFFDELIWYKKIKINLLMFFLLPHRLRLLF